jgi:hypothetical protein
MIRPSGPHILKHEVHRNLIFWVTSFDTIAAYPQPDPRKETLGIVGRQLQDVSLSQFSYEVLRPPLSMERGRREKGGSEPF